MWTWYTMKIFDESFQFNFKNQRSKGLFMQVDFKRLTPSKIPLGKVIKIKIIKTKVNQTSICKTFFFWIITNFWSLKNSENAN